MHSLFTLLEQIRVPLVLDLARWLKINNHVYRHVDIQDNPEQFGLRQPQSEEERVEGVLPDVLVDLASPPPAGTQPQQDSAEQPENSNNDAKQPPGDSDAAASNHSKSTREDASILNELPRDSDGCVHVRQFSTYVADDERRAVGAADGLKERVDRVQKLLQVSDSRKFANEFAAFMWCLVFPLLFPYGRFVRHRIHLSLWQFDTRFLFSFSIFLSF